MAKHLPLLTRLTRQLAADNVPDARDEAIGILRERGHMKKNSTELTVEGKKREALGPAGRAIDRAAKQSGRPKSDYKYIGGSRAVLK
jgi:hypothetical protein